jgi:hypothetical protein
VALELAAAQELLKVVFALLGASCRYTLGKA